MLPLVPTEKLANKVGIKSESSPDDSASKAGENDARLERSAVVEHSDATDTR